MSRESWSSRFTYVATVAGATIGFGATWRFPYLVGQNGGGAYLIIFLIAMFALGVPLLMAESVIGRRLNKNVIDAFSGTAHQGKKIHPAWQILGYLSLIGAFAIMAYYMVLGAWVIGYIKGIMVGDLSLAKPVSYELTSSFFASTIASPVQVIFFTIIFIAINHYILSKGIVAGIEKAMVYLMPLLLVIMLVMIARSVTLPGASKGIIFYLTPDFSKINQQTVLLALGQVFFALSIGFGVIITLASYLKKSEDIRKTSVITGILNTIIPLLSGFIIFPSIFAYGVDPAAGPALVFNALPIVFSNMWFGNGFAILFFTLLLIAALTSAIAIYEVIITILIEKTKLSRRNASLIAVLVIFVFGNIPSALSYSTWADVKLFGKNIFDSFDYISANIVIIITAFFSCIFLGFILKEEAIAELTNNYKINTKIAKVWFYYVKYFIPLIIGVLFVVSFK